MPEEKKTQKSSVGDFSGKVVEVHSGDSLTLLREKDNSTFRVFFAMVKAPQGAKHQDKPESAEPWSWESKETLRSACIGKKVDVVMEFSKTPKEGQRNMDFATVLL